MVKTKKTAPWAHRVAAVASRTFEKAGRRWTLTGDMRGDNCTGTWFVDALDDANNLRSFAIRDLPKALAVDVIRESLEVVKAAIRKMPHYVARGSQAVR